MHTLFRKLDPDQLGQEVRDYVAAVRAAGVNVSIYEHLPSGAIEIITHDGAEPREGVLQALADQHLLDAAKGSPQ